MRLPDDPGGRRPHRQERDDQRSPGQVQGGRAVSGAKHDGLTIQGTKSNAKKVILEGKNAKAPDGQPANNGIEGDGVDGMRVLNLWARNYLANGIFVHDCNGYLMKNLRASFNRATACSRSTARAGG